MLYDLFEDYENEMELNRPFNPEILLGTTQEGRETFHRAFIESENRTDVFITEKEYKRIVQVPPAVPTPTSMIQERIIKEGWEQI